MKKIYIVRVNCSSFEDIEVEANDKKEARDLALSLFQCPQNGGEVGEFLKKTKETN